MTSVQPGDRVAGVPLVPMAWGLPGGDYSSVSPIGFIGSRQFSSFAEYVVVRKKMPSNSMKDVSFEERFLNKPL